MFLLSWFLLTLVSIQIDESDFKLTANSNTNIYFDLSVHSGYYILCDYAGELFFITDRENGFWNIHKWVIFIRLLFLQAIKYVCSFQELLIF